MTRNLTGRRLVVTAAARGIGENVARLAVARGAQVALIGLEPDRLRRTAEDLGPAASWCEADVRDGPALREAIDTSAALMGGPPSSILDDALGRLDLRRRPGGALHVRRRSAHHVELGARVDARPEAARHGAAPRSRRHRQPRKGVDRISSQSRGATEAVRISVERGRPSGHVTQFAEVDIASLYMQDAARGRAFILNELGPLAARNRAMEELRHTLLTYFSHRSNARAAATALFVHHNTVRNRLERAQAHLGHPVQRRRLALELALHLDLALNGPTAY